MKPSSFENSERLSSNVILGIFVVAIGGLLLIDNVFLDLPNWLFKWHTFLVALGLFIGFRNNWKDSSWIILVGIGGFFTARKILPDLNFMSVVFPVALLGLGLYLILKNDRKKQKNYENFPIPDANSDGPQNPDDFAPENYIESVNVFGGSQQVIYSKNFKGGEIIAVFGGCDVNLTQADFTGVAKLEVVAVFGGAKIIVPNGWEVKSEVTSILGGVSDKRPIHPLPEGQRKLLIIEGLAMFGGVDIKTY